MTTRPCTLTPWQVTAIKEDRHFVCLACADQQPEKRLTMITIATLRAHRACAEQVQLFAERFPDGAPMTVEAAVSVAADFDWDWAAQHLLTPANQRTYDEAHAPIWRAYEEARAPIRRAYDEAHAPIRRAYDEARAALFARLYIAQESSR
jgi:hypothetical protein